MQAQLQLEQQVNLRQQLQQEHDSLLENMRQQMLQQATTLQEELEQRLRSEQGQSDAEAAERARVHEQQMQGLQDLVCGELVKLKEHLNQVQEGQAHALEQRMEQRLEQRLEQHLNQSRSEIETRFKSESQQLAEQLDSKSQRFDQDLQKILSQHHEIQASLNELRANQKETALHVERCRSEAQRGCSEAERCRSDLGLAVEKMQHDVVHIAERLREDIAQSSKSSLGAVDKLRADIRAEMMEAIAKRDEANEGAFADLASGLRALSDVFDEQMKDVAGSLREEQQKASSSFASKQQLCACEVSVSSLDKDLKMQRVSLEEAMTYCKNFDDRLAEQSRSWFERLSSFEMRFEGATQERVKECVQREMSKNEILSERRVNDRTRAYDRQDLENKLDHLIHALHLPSGQEFKSVLDSTLYVQKAPPPLLAQHAAMARATSEPRRRHRAFTKAD
jgi:hypothetical protein